MTRRMMQSTFDLVTPKVDRFVYLPHGPRVPICIEIGSFVIVFIGLETVESSTTREHNLPPLATLVCQRGINGSVVFIF